MRAQKTLYVTDLDGTLLDATSSISPKSAQLLNDAIARGANFTIATARTPATLSTILAPIEMQLPAIVMTGSAIWDPRSGKYLDTRFHREQDVRQLLDIYRAHKLPTFVYTMRDNKIHIYHIGALSEAERIFIDERIDNPYKEFHIPPDGESRLPEHLDNVLLLFAIQTTESAREAYPEIRSVGRINSVFYPDIFNPEIAFIEAFPEDATKAKAIKRLQEMHGFNHLVAFGDNVNDLPMFEIANEGIAVANAVDALKEKADLIIGPNTQDAVATEIYNQAEKLPHTTTTGRI